MTMTCRTCGAAIEWVKTLTGKAMPLDAEPSPTGNLVVVDGVAVARFSAEGRAGEVLRTSHFATCPQASTHRRGKK